MDTHFNFDYFNELVEARNYRKLRAELPELNEVDIAQFIDALGHEKATIVFRTLPKGIATSVFSYLTPECQQHIIESITEQEIAVIIEDLFVDDAVDMLEELPANVVKRVLRNAQPETRILINQFLKYPENSAGSIMTSEYIDLSKNMTVGDAIKRIRRIGKDRETIYTCYVIDEQRELDGVVTVKDLLLSNDEQKVEDIMDTSVIKAVTTDDREHVAQLSEIRLPVSAGCGPDNRLVE